MATLRPTSLNPTPCDFLEFLVRERRIEAAAGARLLGRWLAEYEPGEAALAQGARARATTG